MKLYVCFFVLLQVGVAFFTSFFENFLTVFSQWFLKQTKVAFTYSLYATNVDFYKDTYFVLYLNTRINTKNTYSTVVFPFLYFLVFCGFKGFNEKNEVNHKKKLTF